MPQPSAFDHPPRPLAQKVGAILWPSFFAAGVATMVFFAFVDPLALRDMTFPALPMTRGLGYTIGFFMPSGWPPPRRACSPGGCFARPAASTARCRPSADRACKGASPWRSSTTEASLYVSEGKIHPREVSGRFDRLRKVAAVVWLLGMFYVAPWLRWDGRQAVLFDLPARKFHVSA
jgi:hypothetical protein